MTPEIISAIGVILISVLSSFLGVYRYMIKTFLSELKPNGGSSLADKVDRLESRIDDIYNILLSNQKTTKGVKKK
jgi:hypothetical protein